MPQKYTTEEYNQILININSPLRVVPGEKYVNTKTPIKHISVVTGKTFKVCPKYVIRDKDKLREFGIGQGRTGKKKTTEEYKQELIDNGLTCTLAPNEEYINARTKIWHICSCKTPFLRKPYRVLTDRSDKCFKCTKKIKTKKLASSRRAPYSHQEFLKVLEKVNSNIRVVQGQTYKNNHTKLLFHCCECGVATLSSPQNVLQKGIVLCKKCQKKSLGERIIAQYLEDNDIFYVPQHHFDDCKDIHLLLFDFWVDNNFIIEYDGVFHYKNVHGYLEEQRRHDEIKNSYCTFYEIPLIRVKESEYRNFDQMQEDIVERLEHGISELQWGDKIIVRV